MKEAERATALMPTAKDAVYGRCFEENLALLEAFLGEKNRTIPIPAWL